MPKLNSIQIPLMTLPTSCEQAKYTPNHKVLTVGREVVPPVIVHCCFVQDVKWLWGSISNLIEFKEASSICSSNSNTSPLSYPEFMTCTVASAKGNQTYLLAAGSSCWTSNVQMTCKWALGTAMAEPVLWLLRQPGWEKSEKFSAGFRRWKAFNSARFWNAWRRASQFSSWDVPHAEELMDLRVVKKKGQWSWPGSGPWYSKMQWSYERTCTHRHFFNGELPNLKETLFP